MGNRRIGRETALQYLFSHDLNGGHDGPESLFALRMAKQHPFPDVSPGNGSGGGEKTGHEPEPEKLHSGIGSDSAHCTISRAGLPALVSELENALAETDSKPVKRKLSKQLKLARDHSRNNDFVEILVRGVLDNQAKIDGQIEDNLENFTLARLATIDRNVLRIAVFEMFHSVETPPIVAINEAIELAKRFGTEQSGSFVNGILDRLKDELTRPLRN